MTLISEKDPPVCLDLTCENILGNQVTCIYTVSAKHVKCLVCSSPDIQSPSIKQWDRHNITSRELILIHNEELISFCTTEHDQKQRRVNFKKTLRDSRGSRPPWKLAFFLQDEPNFPSCKMNQTSLPWHGEPNF